MTTTTNSSTSLGYMTKHCPKAYRLHMAGQRGDASVFQVGVAAHAVLEEIGKRRLAEPAHIKAVADDVAQILMSHGRDYFGIPEPPVPADQALAGRDLALAYLETHVLPDGEYERALYMDINDGATTYRVRSLIDVVFEEDRGDEEFSGPCLVVRDFKSAWTANDDELETLQRKMQAVIAWGKLGREDLLGLVLEVENLRTGRTHSRTIWMDEEGEMLLAGWRADILILCRAAEQALDDPDACPAAPGIGCLSCPFSATCEECAEAAMRPAATVEEQAVKWLAMKTVLANVTRVLKERLKDAEPVTVPGGTVGFQRKERDEPVADAYAKVLSEWHERLGHDIPPEEVAHKLPAQLTLLMTLKPGKTALEAVAKNLYPERTQVDDRRAFLRTLVEPVAVAEFGEKKA